MKLHLLVLRFLICINSFKKSLIFIFVKILFRMGEKCPEAERINALTNEQEANKEIFIAGLEGKSKVC